MLDTRYSSSIQFVPRVTCPWPRIEAATAQLFNIPRYNLCYDLLSGGSRKGEAFGDGHRQAALDASTHPNLLFLSASGGSQLPFVSIFIVSILTT